MKMEDWNQKIEGGLLHIEQQLDSLKQRLDNQYIETEQIRKRLSTLEAAMKDLQHGKG